MNDEQGNVTCVSCLGPELSCPLFRMFSGNQTWTWTTGTQHRLIAPMVCVLRSPAHDRRSRIEILHADWMLAFRIFFLHLIQMWFLRVWKERTLNRKKKKKGIIFRIVDAQVPNTNWRWQAHGPRDTWCMMFFNVDLKSGLDPSTCVKVPSIQWQITTTKPR